MNLENRVAKGLLFELFREPNQTQYSLSKRLRVDKGRIRYWLNMLAKPDPSLLLKSEDKNARYKLNREVIVGALYLESDNFKAIILEDIK